MNVILLGQAPLPISNHNRTNAPGYRAWHFAQALAAAGHAVHLLAVSADSEKPCLPEAGLPNNIKLYYFNEAQITQTNVIAELVKELKPALAIGASIFPSYLAALYLPPELPLWADMFGSPLAEAQAKAYIYKDDSLIEPYARFERTVLARADKFSAVANPQKYALIGELALLGRLRVATFGYQFVHTIAAATDETMLPHSETVLRGKIVPENAFVVLWSGGYNTWTDVDTLFAGLEQAMAQDPHLHFVSTGGALPPHDAKTYPHFEGLVAGSPYKERYHLLGWLPLELVHNYYYEADVGIILDKWSYEGELGSRTRLVDWLKYGLPAITTVTAELTADLVKAGAAFSFEHGDNAGLARLLLDLANQPERLKQAAQTGRAYVLKHYHYKAVCAPLISWASHPHSALDKGMTPVFELELGSNVTAERKLLEALAHLEEKNAQIAGLEDWAKQLETTLQQKEVSPFAKARQKLNISNWKSNLFKKS